MAAPAPPRSAPSRLLLADRRRLAIDVACTVVVDRTAWGAVSAAVGRRAVRRAEPGPHGPLVLEARAEGGNVVLEVWGPASTPAEDAQRGLQLAAAWAGCDDDPATLAAAVTAHPLLRQLHRHVGEVRLSRLPSVDEALGRAILAQLVQSAEAHRSTAQLVRWFGEPAPFGLWCWPAPERLGATHASALRRCGISLRGARALHAGVLAHHRLHEASQDFTALDQRLRSLPGVGVWTSGEVRATLGDPDAVSVGDYNLPGLIGHVLAGDRDCDDAGMLSLLDPFAGQRGRVVRLIERALAARIVTAPRRRAPRAALSAHRYW